jgi:hypothetical protein
VRSAAAYHAGLPSGSESRCALASPTRIERIHLVRRQASGESVTNVDERESKSCGLSEGRGNAWSVLHYQGPEPCAGSTCSGSHSAQNAPPQTPVTDVRDVSAEATADGRSRCRERGRVVFGAFPRLTSYLLSASANAPTMGRALLRSCRRHRCMQVQWSSAALHALTRERAEHGSAHAPWDESFLSSTQ